MKLVDFLYMLNKNNCCENVLFIVIVNTGYILKSINELKQNNDNTGYVKM